MTSHRSVYFLPGEKVINTKSIAQGILIQTNYRLIFSTLHPKTIWSIPITLLWRVELVGLLHVKVITKLGISVVWSFDNELACEVGFAYISSIIETSKLSDSIFACEFRLALVTNIPNHPFLMNPTELLQIDDVDRSLDTALACFEFRRMNFNKSWKITDVNEEFKICSSYPRHHIVPRSINDNDIINMASFRSHNRFSSVIWRSQNTGAVLLRCAQPCVGLMYSRNEHDEKFLRAVLSSCQKNPGENPCLDCPRLLIVDARNYSTAQFNRFRGGGFEYSEYYDQAQICFMDLPNLHIVRVSFERLTQLYASKPDANWYTMLEKTSWLTYIGQLLKAATEIACALELHGRPVMVHCTDGWDRTPQLSSLAQLLVDPFYRTVKGFRILIVREWLQFGHKFADRNGQCGVTTNTDERSPIFLQWLDCVHQICKQFPHCFEFNESFLLKMGLHIYSGLFGTFMYNSEHERRNASVVSRTCSLWALLSPKHNWTILNYFYEPQSERLINPTWEVRTLSLWSALYETALAPTKTHSSNLIPNTVVTNSPNFDSHSAFPVPSPSCNLKRNSSTIFDFDETCKQNPSPTDSTTHLVLSDFKLHDTPDPQLSHLDLLMRGVSVDTCGSRPLDDVEFANNSQSQTDDCSQLPLFDKYVSIPSSNHQPAILKLSSFTDDTGMCSSWTSKPYIQSSSSSMNNNVDFLSSDVNSKLDSNNTNESTLSLSTHVVNHIQRNDNLMSVEENVVDMFVPDEHFDSNEEYSHLGKTSNSLDNCSFLPSILPLDDDDDDMDYANHSRNFTFSQQQSRERKNSSRESANSDSGAVFPHLHKTNSNENCATSTKTCPISILSPNTNLTSLNSTVKHSECFNEGVDAINQHCFDNNLRWSVTTPGSSASLYVLSDLKHSSPIDQLKPSHTESTNHSFEMEKQMDKTDFKIGYSEYTIHSLPENEGLLINESDFVAYHHPHQTESNMFMNFKVSHKSKNKRSDYYHSSSNASSCVDLDKNSRPINLSSMAGGCSTNIYQASNESCHSLDNNNNFNVSNQIISYSSDDLNTWCEKYFRSEPLFKFIPSSLANYVEHKSESPFHDPTTSYCENRPNPNKVDGVPINFKNRTLKPGASFDLNVDENASIGATQIDANRPVSAPISPMANVSQFCPLDGECKLHQMTQLGCGTQCHSSMDNIVVNSDSNLLNQERIDTKSKTMVSCFTETVKFM